MTHHILIHTTPVPWARARTNGKVFFTAKKQADYVKYIQSRMRAMFTLPPYTGPISLNLTFGLKCPKTAKVSTPFGRVGDVSNFVKIIEDAGNRILWADDCQIIKLNAVKVYSEGQPYVDISFQEIR